MAAEEVGILVAEVLAEDLEEEVEKVEEENDEEVVEEASAHMKTELKSQMSHVTLNIRSGLHYQMIQRKGSLRTPCTQRYWQIIRAAPPSLSVMKRILRIV